MASAQVVETSVVNNSPSQDFSHPDDHFQSRNNNDDDDDDDNNNNNNCLRQKVNLILT